jgi:hypothetical protein
MEPTSAASPSDPPRLSFLLSVLGALVAGVGVTRPWTLVSGFLTPSRGIDDIEGLLVLLLAVAILVSALAARQGRSGTARRSAALVTIVAAALIIGIGVYAALTLPARVRTQEIDDGVADAVAQGFDAQAVRVQLEGSVSVERQDGIWLCIAGGALGLAGGILTLRWAKGAGSAGPDASAGAGEPTPADGPAA